MARWGFGLPAASARSSPAPAPGHRHRRRRQHPHEPRRAETATTCQPAGEGGAEQLRRRHGVKQWQKLFSSRVASRQRQVACTRRTSPRRRRMASSTRRPRTCEDVPAVVEFIRFPALFEVIIDRDAGVQFRWSARARPTTRQDHRRLHPPAQRAGGPGRRRARLEILRAPVPAIWPRRLGLPSILSSVLSHHVAVEQATAACSSPTREARPADCSRDFLTRSPPGSRPPAAAA